MNKLPLRVRLALWYGLLCGTVLSITAVFSYAFHTRGHYDDLDLALISTASHAAEEVRQTGDFDLAEASEGLTIGLRIYAPDGDLVRTQPGLSVLDTSDPLRYLREPAGPAYDAVAGLTPSLMGADVEPGDGAFGLLEQEGRWRLYILPVYSQDSQLLIAYVEAIAPLQPLDRAISAFRAALLGLCIIALLAGFAGSWSIAHIAMRPVAHMVEVAHDISQARDFSRRVTLPPQQDELSVLAATFNEMLDNLERAYRAEQRFVSDASHELRAPLTSIQGNLDLLSRNPQMPDSERRETVNEASREAARLSRLVSDLLALARADAGQRLRFEAIEIERLALDAFAEARHLARGQELRLGTIEAAPALGHADSLKQLFLILLDNALRHTAPGGQLTLSIQRDASHICVALQDTGAGIPEEALPHLFERFYRTDQARLRDPEGTGLGLAIAAWIVEQHQGRIEIESQLGQGTLVRVILPALSPA